MLTIGSRLQCFWCYSQILCLQAMFHKHFEAIQSVCSLVHFSSHSSDGNILIAWALNVVQDFKTPMEMFLSSCSEWTGSGDDKKNRYNLCCNCQTGVLDNIGMNHIEIVANNFWSVDNTLLTFGCKSIVYTVQPKNLIFSFVWGMLWNHFFRFCGVVMVVTTFILPSNSKQIITQKVLFSIYLKLKTVDTGFT